MEDYADAAYRHFEDAKLLHSQSPARLANASHLYGFSFECVLKTIMSGAAKNGVAKKHMPEILAEFLNHSVVKGNSRLAETIRRTSSGAFDMWLVSERYWHRQSTCFNSSRLTAEHESSQKLLNILEHWKRGRI
ncbi:hypothetical protein [Acidovorax sp. SUPP3334]|uniref:hypothetical protein n=1 Tax=Acidovorax sp. SUPP3334 TaxID=2920881 RepID=UPI0023DE3B23|nr:hypothetical protein [Acidovorax sp. SUPP3334]GKT22431.1 SAM-dependent methyltransferase [Acidovorax sp. SUPP3334]